MTLGEMAKSISWKSSQKGHVVVYFQEGRYIPPCSFPFPYLHADFSICAEMPFKEQGKFLL